MVITLTVPRESGYFKNTTHPCERKRPRSSRSHGLLDPNGLKRFKCGWRQIAFSGEPLGAPVHSADTPYFFYSPKTFVEALVAALCPMPCPAHLAFALVQAQGQRLCKWKGKMRWNGKRMEGPGRATASLALALPLLVEGQGVLRATRVRATKL